MKKLLPLFFAGCIPAMLFWAVILIFAFIPHGTWLLPIALLGFVLCFILALIFSFLFFSFYRAAVMDRASARKKYYKIGFAVTTGFLVAIILYMPITWSANSAAWYLKKPARERVAQRIISVAKKENYENNSQVYLRRGEYYLSDNGPVYYYTNGRASAVVFWDFQGGVLGNGASATLYVSDPSERRLPENAEPGNYEHKSGHWWTTAE